MYLQNVQLFQSSEKFVFEFLNKISKQKENIVFKSVLGIRTSDKWIWLLSSVTLRMQKIFFLYFFSYNSRHIIFSL
jgi:hypothetical protein